MRSLAKEHLLAGILVYRQDSDLVGLLQDSSYSQNLTSAFCTGLVQLMVIVYETMVFSSGET